MSRFTVTYEIVTPESAEDGDCVDHGFVTPGDWHWPMGSEITPSRGQVNMSLREAVDLASPDCDCGRWFGETSQDRRDYATGAVETRSIHPPQGITPSSYARVKRLLRAR